MESRVSDYEGSKFTSVSSSNSEPENHATKSFQNSEPRSAKLSKSGNLSKENSCLSTTNSGNLTADEQNKNIPSTTSASTTKTNSEVVDSTFKASLSRFHLFFWLTAIPGEVSEPRDSPKGNEAVDIAQHTHEKERSFLIDTHKLGVLISEMERYFSSSEFKHRHIYKRCPSSTLLDVETRLSELVQELKVERRDVGGNAERKAPDESGRNLASSSKSNDVNEEYLKRKSLERPEGKSHSRRGSSSHHQDSRAKTLAKVLRKKKDFVRTARQLFQFFLPLDYTSNMAGKFWGAVYSVIVIVAPKLPIRQLLKIYTAS